MTVFGRVRFAQVVAVMDEMLMDMLSNDARFVRCPKPGCSNVIEREADTGALPSHAPDGQVHSLSISFALFRAFQPEIAQYPKSTCMRFVIARGGPVPIRSSHSPAAAARGATVPALSTRAILSGRVFIMNTISLMELEPFFQEGG